MYIIDIINRVAEFYNEFSVWITLCVTLITCIVAKILPIKLFIKKRKLKRILKFNSQPVEFYIATMVLKTKKLSNSEQAKRFLNLGETKSIVDMSQTIKIAYASKDINFPNYKGNSYDRNCSYNRIACGGPFTNRDTYLIFQQFCNPIKFEVFKKYYDKYKDYKLNDNCTLRAQVLELSEPVDASKGVLYFKYGSTLNKSISYKFRDENLIFLIRIRDTGKNILTQNYIKNNFHGTIHILFGLDENSTYIANTIFKKYTDEFYELIKHKKNNYAIIIKVMQNAEIDFKYAVDVTDDFFKKDSI